MVRGADPTKLLAKPRNRARSFRGKLLRTRSRCVRESGSAGYNGVFIQGWSFTRRHRAGDVLGRHQVANQLFFPGIR